MKKSINELILHLKEKNTDAIYHNKTDNINILSDSQVAELEMQAEDTANQIVEKFWRNQAAPLQLGTLMQQLGFKIFTSKNFKENDLSGILALNIPSLLKDGSNYPDKLIMVNGNDNIGHQRFTIAHELAHYIFDSVKEQEYYEAYYRTKTADEKTIREYRANKFAANLLMPAELFKNRYEHIAKLTNNPDFIRQILSEDFGVSPTAVKKRLEELNLTAEKGYAS